VEWPVGRADQMNRGLRTGGGRVNWVQGPQSALSRSSRTISEESEKLV
jgi:hypothetical protein